MRQRQKCIQSIGRQSDARTIRKVDSHKQIQSAAVAAAVDVDVVADRQKQLQTNN